MDDIFLTYMGLKPSHLNFENFKNEIDFMDALLSDECMKQHFVLYFDSLKQYGANNSRTDMENKSKILREDGNKLYKSNVKNKENILASCRLYTEAIYAAPEHSESLALAHANRAVILLEFGYFQEAYDDCKCARKEGYPKEKIPKVVIRQANCSWKMGNAEFLDLHLKELTKMKLDKNMTQQVKALRAGLIKLSNDEEKKQTVTSNESSFQQKTQTIVETSGPRGSYMIAKDPIKNGDVIFSDCAAVFVRDKETNHQMCHQCAKTLFIPFPCCQCDGEVVYCSLNCRELHADIHKYECFAYKFKILEKMDNSVRLALRIILKELPRVLPLLREKRYSKGIWKRLTNRNGTLVKKNIPYTKILRLLTNFDKMPLDRISACALQAYLVLCYMKECTKFFNLMEDSEARQCDWELVVGSLLLRHICQININITGNHSIGIDRDCEKNDFPLMSDGFWLRPYHVRRGFLHKFIICNPITNAIYPYLSKCNHSCESSFEMKLSGPYMYALAVKNIKAGDEISYTYDQHYRQSKQIERQNQMETVLYFKCECEKCTRSNPDQDLEKFHRYRCDNRNCARIFVPCSTNLRWWMEQLHLKCTHCGKIQNISWIRKYVSLIKNLQFVHLRVELLNRFEKLHKNLIEKNELKMTLGIGLVQQFLAAHCAGLPLTDIEFKKLLNILKFNLATAAEMYDTSNVVYVGHALPLWDFIALGKYKCTHNEMNNMLKGIEIVSDEIKKILLNYYEHYIKSLLI